MCQLKINFPQNLSNEVKLGSLELETVPICGSCKNRNWCPVFIVAIKQYAKEICDKYPSKSDAIVKILLNKEEAYEKGKHQYVIVYMGALDLIKHDNSIIEFVNEDEGKLFLKDILNNESILNTVKELIVTQEEVV